MTEKEFQESYYFDRLRKMSYLYRKIFFKRCGYNGYNQDDKDIKIKSILQLNDLNSGKKVLILENGKKLTRE